MATQLLAVGTNSTPSADFTIAAGAQATIALKATAPAGIGGSSIYCSLQLKDDAGSYWDVDYLDGINKRAIVVVGAGTYRLVRTDSGTSFGVFRD